MAPPPPSYSFPSVRDLTQVQREHVDRLWSSQIQHELYAPTNGSSRLTKVDDHSLYFVVRLHFFFLAMLQEAYNDNNNNGATSRRNHRTSRLHKGPHQSCLGPWTRLVISYCTSTKKATVRLLQGSHVVSVPHEDFLTELNSFELKGQRATDDFILRHSFGAFLHHRPKHALTTVRVAAGLATATLWKSTNVAAAAAQLFQTTAQQTQEQPDPITTFLDNCQLVIRFVHVQPQVPMINVKTSLAYKFVTVRGHVVKARPRRLLVTSADFMCQKCGTSNISHCFLEGRYSIPNKCSTSKCRSHNFTLIRPTAKYVNVQEIKLQEVQEETTTHAGRTPRQIEVQLAQDLVDSCRPGDIVSVAGMIQAVNSAIAAGRSGKRAMENSTYHLYIQAHSVTTMSETNSTESENTNNGKQRNRDSSSTSNMVYTQQQLQSITQLSHADHRFFGLIERRAFPFDLLVRSLCPSIIGHDLVKAGILLGLLGGTPPPCVTSSNAGTTTRHNSHILIVGDPSVGKSQMLLAASQLAARSVYVGGNTTSTTGLTVSLTKEAGGEVGIEAGALVLADQGICCIDEFDKMAKVPQDGLLEAMEQQQISIAKAGIVASLPARCSVIAAANPRHGSYNTEQTVQENLNMSAPILSRFDLVFILRDRADLDQDRLVSSNIMNLYLEKENIAVNPSNKNETKRNAPFVLKGSSVDSDNRLPLKDRLGWVAGFQQEAIPADLVRDYVSYAREYCKPKLTQEAAAALKDYFMKLRYPPDESQGKNNTVPITTRQLEALIRLSQARAKACLREFVLEEDAMDVVELMMESVKQVHADDNGGGMISRGRGGKSKNKMRKSFVEELKQLAGQEVAVDDLRRIANQVGCGLAEFPSLVDEMRNGGILMKKANGSFQIMT